MNEYIERLKIERILADMYLNRPLDSDRWLLADIERKLNEVPVADVRENVRGEWTLVTDRYGANGEYVWKCSSCKKMTICKGDFCPNCGADMKRRTDGEIH